MSMSRDCFHRNLKMQLDNNPDIRGLSAFRQQLEKDYFAEVQVRNRRTDSQHINLIIEIDCNFSLEEVVYLIDHKQWGIHSDHLKHKSGTSFSEALSDLSQLNNLEIDIEEFSIFLKDTSVIIKKIYDRSIPDQLSELFNSLVEHYITLTKNCSEAPYELYIPVFEEDLFENDLKIAAIEQGNNDKKDYFGFWGLYFDSEEDAVIYDLNKRRIFTGELYMLNH